MPYFFERHWEELLKFSRRTPRQLERWAARYGHKEQPMEILDHAKKNCRLFLSDDELKAMAWTTFVAGIQPERYPELVRYLKERRLYVNEPVESEVEA